MLDVCVFLHCVCVLGDSLTVCWFATRYGDGVFKLFVRAYSLSLRGRGGQITGRSSVCCCANIITRCGGEVPRTKHLRGLRKNRERGEGGRGAEMYLETVRTSLALVVKTK